MDGTILTNASSPRRSSTDFYPTPPNVTLALLNYLKLPTGTRIWEPACGEGHMANVFKYRGFEVVSTDLYYRGYGQGGKDFLHTDFIYCDWIITNPPFSLSEAFIRRCIKQGKPFALLFKSQFWHAAKKRKLFEAYRPEAVLPLSWRPNFLFAQTERKSGSPLMEVCWTVWGDMPAQYTIYQPLEKPV
jgi:hypothetical protein